MPVEFHPKFKGYITKDGKIMGVDRRVLDRWMEHFRELLNKGEKEEEVRAQTMMVIMW